MKPQSATVLFAELPGFAGLSAHLSSKEFNALLKECYEITNSTARLHQGLLSNFSGDSFTTVFISKKSGSPTALPAIEATSELRERLEIFFSGKKLPVAVGFKAGIASGEAIVEEFGVADEKHVTVMGEAVGFATRLCDFAEEGQVLVNREVFETAKEQYNFQKLEPLPIRGSKNTLSVFELQGKKRTKLHPEAFSERKIASEMVGRNREMETVEGQIKKLIAGKGSVVNIIGKAGIGKSRLMAEMKIQPLMKKVAIFEGRAQSMGKNLSFHPLVHIIKSWAGITEDDKPAVSSEKLQRSVQRLSPEQANEIFPFIATMMGLPLIGKAKERVAGIEGEALEKLILKNMRDLITAAATVRPLIIIIEDMHWADSSSITFLESLFKLARNQQIMFINVFRPGHEDTGDYILKFLEENFPQDHMNINIEPLAEAESKELIWNLLQKASLPNEINELIIRKTEGNPFFIEEIIRSFIDEGIIEIKNNEFRLTEKIHQANIPENINEVILSRVDKLDEKTKDLLKTASVIGRNFYYKVLEEAADTIGELDSRLEYLKDVQLIGESKKKDEIEYLFKHALAQQATYESILLDSKKELHLKIARSIEKVFSENLNEFYGTLAYHYEKAENEEKTEEYLIKAGDEAMRTGASSEAIQFFLNALARIRNKDTQHTQHEKILDLEEKLAYAYYANGQNVKSAELFNTVLRSHNLTATTTSRMLTQLKVIAGLIRLWWRIKAWNGKINREDNIKNNSLLKMLLFRGEAIATYSPQETFYQAILATNKLSIQFILSSDYGIGVLLEISTVFPWSGRFIGFGKLLNKFAWKVMNEKVIQVWLIGKYVGVMFEYFSGKLSPDSDDEKAFRFGMETGQVWAPTVYHSFKSISLVELGLKEQVVGIIENMKTLATTLENSLSLTQYFRAKQTFLLKFRRLDELIANADEIIGLTIKTDHKTMLFLNYCMTSMAYSLKNDTQQARDYYLKAEELQKALWINYYLSMALLTRAFIELTELKSSDRSPNRELLADFSKTTKALVSATKKVNCTKTEAYRFRALAYQFSGNSKKALGYYKKSIDFAHWYGAKLELSRTYFELGKFLSDPKTKQKKFNGLSGKDYLEKAKAMFEEMDLQWDLEEYEKFVGRG